MFKSLYTTSPNKKSSGRTSMEGHGAGRPLEIGAENELRLADHLFVSARCKYGLSQRDVLELAGEFIREEKIKTRWVNGIPGQDWLKNYLKRHPRLVTYKDEVCSIKQANPLDVREFFQDLDQLYEEEEVTSDDAYRIYSLLEISLSCEEQSKSTDSFPYYDKRKASVLTCICADGGRLPPLVVFQGDCVSCERNGTISKCSNDEILFCYWFENFFIPTLPKSKKSTILFLEGQSFRINFHVLRLARRNKVFFVKFPPKLSCMFQPLDSKYSLDLKSMYNEQFGKEVKSHKKFDDSHRESFGNNVGATWEKSVNMNTIVKGFEKTGLFPLDKLKFSKTYFVELSLEKIQETEKIDVKGNIRGTNNCFNPLLAVSENSELVQVPKITHVTSVATFGLKDTIDLTASSKEGSSSPVHGSGHSEIFLGKEIPHKESFSVEFKTNKKESIDEKSQDGDDDTRSEDDEKDAKYEGDVKESSYVSIGKCTPLQCAIYQEDDKDASYKNDDNDLIHQGDEKTLKQQVDNKDAKYDEHNKDLRHQVNYNGDTTNTRHDNKDQNHENDADISGHHDCDKDSSLQVDDNKDSSLQCDVFDANLQRKGINNENYNKNTGPHNADKDERLKNDIVEDIPKTAQAITNRRRSERIFRRDFSGKVKITSPRKTI